MDQKSKLFIFDQDWNQSKIIAAKSPTRELHLANLIEKDSHHLSEFFLVVVMDKVVALVNLLFK